MRRKSSEAAAEGLAGTAHRLEGTTAEITVLIGITIQDKWFWLHFKHKYREVSRKGGQNKGKKSIKSTQKRRRDTRKLQLISHVRLKS